MLAPVDLILQDQFEKVLGRELGLAGIGQAIGQGVQDA